MRPLRRGMGNQIGDRIAEEQAKDGEAQAYDEGAPEQAQVDTVFERARGDTAVDAAFQVQGVQVVAGGEALAGLTNGVPGLRIAPRRVGAHQRVAPRGAFCFAQAPRCAGDDGAQPAAHTIDARRHPSQGALLTRLAQLSGDGLEHGLVRRAFAIPLLQQAQGVGQCVSDHRIVDASRQHGRQRGNEGEPDKGDQGKDEPDSAKPRADQRASHALKRSFISSPWSRHHCQSWTRARAVFSGLLGICGRMSTPVSRWVPIKAVPDLRAGL